METTFEMTGLRGEAGGNERGISVRRYGEHELLIRVGLTTDTQSTYAYITRSEALAPSDVIRVMARTLEHEDELPQAV